MDEFVIQRLFGAGAVFTNGGEAVKRVNPVRVFLRDVLDLFPNQAKVYVFRIYIPAPTPALPHGGGSRSAADSAYRTKWRLKNAVSLMLQGFKRGQNL